MRPPTGKSQQNLGVGDKSTQLDGNRSRWKSHSNSQLDGNHTNQQLKQQGNKSRLLNRETLGNNSQTTRFAQANHGEQKSATAESKSWRGQRAKSARDGKISEGKSRRGQS
ncbi:hypothetical protein Dimus_022385 [Dionaea muscipula]